VNINSAVLATWRRKYYG